MAHLISYVMAHWQNAVIAIVAVDAALIPIFPKVGILVAVKNFLSGLLPKSGA